jgi:hypothetical protein
MLLSLILLLPVSFAAAPAAGMIRSHQLLGAFFYPWYGHYNHWNLSGLHPPVSWASKFLPSVYDTNDPARALYDSNDTNVILWQLGKMKQAGLDFAVSSWWGRGSYDDMVLRKIILGIMPRNDNPFRDLRWSIVYEKVRFADPSVEDIVQDLQYLKATFGSSSNILRINGRMVLFVAGARGDVDVYAEKWSEAAKRVVGLYLVLNVFGGYSALARKADAWYQFAPANRIQFDNYYWGYVSPGYWMYNESAPRLTRNPTEFAIALRRLCESNVHFALIETWNDWNEGTQIEPGIDRATGESYGDLYVNLTRQIMKENRDTAPVQPMAQVGILLLTIVVMLVIVPAACRGAKRARHSLT